MGFLSVVSPAMQFVHRILSDEVDSETRAAHVWRSGPSLFPSLWFPNGRSCSTCPSRTARPKPLVPRTNTAYLMPPGRLANVSEWREKGYYLTRLVWRCCGDVLCGVRRADLQRAIKHCKSRHLWKQSAASLLIDKLNDAAWWIKYQPLCHFCNNSLKFMALWHLCRTHRNKWNKKGVFSILF